MLSVEQKPVSRVRILVFESSLMADLELRRGLGSVLHSKSERARAWLVRQMSDDFVKMCSTAPRADFATAQFADLL